MASYYIPKDTPVVPLRVGFSDSGRWTIAVESNGALPVRDNWFFTEKEVLTPEFNYTQIYEAINFYDYAYILVPNIPPEPVNVYNAFRVQKCFIR